jgi:hypothetical protein
MCHNPESRIMGEINLGQNPGRAFNIFQDIQSRKGIANIANGRDSSVMERSTPARTAVFCPAIPLPTKVKRLVKSKKNSGKKTSYTKGTPGCMSTVQ